MRTTTKIVIAIRTVEEKYNNMFTVQDIKNESPKQISLNSIYKTVEELEEEEFLKVITKEGSNGKQKVYAVQL
jgi:Fe2+ or Zn2+ uptake regulation protein